MLPDPLPLGPASRYAALSEAGVPMAYGSDLLGEMHRRQSEEFTIRGQVLPAQEIIASATSIAAEVLGMAGRLGTVACHWR